MKVFIFSMLLLSISSCSTQNLKITNGNPRTVPNYEGTSHFVFWGLGQEKLIDPKEICADKKVAQVSTSTSFLNGLLNGITFGIYAPRSFAIYCE